MNYAERTIPLEDAWKQTARYPFVLAYMMSDVILGKTSDIIIDRDELIEARFFSENNELHIFRWEKEWKAVIVEDSGGSKDILIKCYPIAGRYRKVGNELVVKEYLSKDEDGQAYVKLTRLCGIA